MSKPSLRLSVLAGLLGLAAGCATAQTQQQVAPLVNGMYGALEALYKDLHAHPELAFQEVRTAAKMAEEMRKLGFEVTEKVGGTGVVALLRNGAGPTVLVRTELDALPMEEKTGLPYASQVKAQYAGRETFVAHSCAHDLHMASWVGAARTLVALKSQWKGTLMFVAQPAEETVSGAKAMLADGLFTRFPKPDFAFALHSSPSPYGFVGYRSGPTSSNSDALEIIFKGRGGHGSAPDKTIDPITIAARFITDVQTVVSREKDPAEFGVVTIGAVQGGTVGNIIPDTVVLRGTIRSYQPQVREKLLAGIRRTALAAAAMGGAPEPQVELVPGGAAIVNDAAVVERTTAALKAALPGVQVAQVPPITASEDFSEFLNAGVPGMMFFVGVSKPEDVAAAMKPGGKPLPFNHSPFFAPVPEPSIKTSVQAMSVAVLTALGAP
ncbi:peptidase M20 [Pseudorhodoferax aquiterrae]|uniref:Peptidase M20 n=1 Tax=Pseudorhodoferax aquiterrae TaxID=747304 RepID=A0ABQ3FUN4_9BURK|nr:amidohydrolase [Pseudorhodoferax aquiterrae]GHC68484.1 peptidase M20 [Pseudorhodoferax aquiterrae]